VQLIADGDPAGLEDLAEDPEVDLLALPETAVGDDRAEGVEIRDPRVGMLGRDRAAGVRLRDRQDRRTDREPAAEPAVLLMGPEPCHLEEHPEPAAVDRRDVGPLGELGERAVADEADRVLAPGPTGPIAAHDADRPPGERLEGGSPGTDHDMADGRAVVDDRLDWLAELDVSFDHGAVRKPEPQPRRVGIRVGRDLDEPPQSQAIEQAALVVGQVEAAVLEDARRAQLDGRRVPQPEAPDRRDRDAADGGHAGILAAPRLADHDVADLEGAGSREQRDVEHEVDGGRLDGPSWRPGTRYRSLGRRPTLSSSALARRSNRPPSKSPIGSGVCSSSSA